MENGENLPDHGYRDYGLGGKIMLGAMVVLFFVVIVMVCLHLYLRWYLLRARRRQQLRRRSRLVFAMYTNDAAPPGAAAVRGLDAAIIKSLPVFAYSSKSHFEPIDCSVCLCEFEENETGRVLPKCNHSFHTECIDMWFQSHSTCPLCRAPVEAAEKPVSSGEVLISVGEESVINEPGSSSGSCSDCKNDLEFPVNRARKKPLMASLDIPRRNERFGTGSESTTPATQSHKSPISRMLSHSFERILGREKRVVVSPSGNAVFSCPEGSPDVERGGEEFERHV